MEREGGVGSLTYRYVYGLEKLEAVITGIPNGAGSVMQYIYDDDLGEFVLSTQSPAGNVATSSIVKLYYHHDKLGTTNFLTDNVDGKVASFVAYDDWGAPTMKAILRMGVRELDLVTEYTGHPYDQVLNTYYARARMYDAVDRRFMAVDPVKGYVVSPQTITQYVYVLNNPVRFYDPWGLALFIEGNYISIDDIYKELQKLTDDKIYLQYHVDYENGYEVKILEENVGDKPTGTALIRDLIKHSKATIIRERWNTKYTNYTEPYSPAQNRANGIGTNSRVVIDTFSKVEFNTIDLSGKISKTVVPTQIILGHELIHAIHMMKGELVVSQMDVYKNWNWNTKPKNVPSYEGIGFTVTQNKSGKWIAYLAPIEDLKTTGIPYFPLIKCLPSNWTFDLNDLGALVNPMLNEPYTENSFRIEQGLPLRIEYETRAIYNSGFFRTGLGAKIYVYPNIPQEILDAALKIIEG